MINKNNSIIPATSYTAQPYDSSDVYAYPSPSNNHMQNNVKQGEESNQNVEISVLKDEEENHDSKEMNKDNQKNPLFSKSSVIIVNVNDIDYEDGWHLHSQYDNEEKYYYYNDGIRIKKMERMADGKWKETDFLTGNVYEIGDHFDGNIRDGVFKKYENNVLTEVNTYKKGKQIDYRQVIEQSVMNEYDLKGNLVYCGGYKETDKGYVLREGNGKEYCDGNIVYEGKWTDDIPNGYGKLYRDGTCIQGEWNMGYINFKDKGYYYTNKTSRRTMNVIPWIWSEIACIVVMFCYGSIAYCITRDIEHLYFAFFSEIIYFLILLCQQSIFPCYLLCTIIFGVILFYYCFAVLSCDHELFVTFLINVSMSIIYSKVFSFRRKYPNDTLVKHLCGTPVYCFIVIHFLTCCIYIVHCTMYLLNSHYYTVNYAIVVFDILFCVISVVLAYISCFDNIYYIPGDKNGVFWP